MTEALKQVGNHFEAPPRSPSLFNIGEVSSRLGIPVWQRGPSTMLLACALAPACPGAHADHPCPITRLNKILCF